MPTKEILIEKLKKGTVRRMEDWDFRAYLKHPTNAPTEFITEYQSLDSLARSIILKLPEHERADVSFGPYDNSPSLNYKQDVVRIKGVVNDGNLQILAVHYNNYLKNPSLLKEESE